MVRNKRLFLIILCFWSTVHAFTAGLVVHKTGYFDIIYSKESEKSAALLAEYADSFAEEIAARLNKSILVRMPVYIVAGAENLNGYFTFFPYPRIVIFDTVPDDGILGNLSDVMLKVFYHELTHAISLIYFLPVLPLSFNEGAAVSYESLDGQQGRLNDPLFYHHLIQGKIDGCVPTWQQAAGHRDIYPGAFWGYLYGAGFADYIQKIYGMEAYSRYWHSSFRLFPNSKTKHIFGKPLKQLWKEFICAIPVPETIRLPIPFSEERKSGFTLTASNGKGFACFDFNEKEVRFYMSDGSSTRLFKANHTLSHLSFSQDGSRLLITDTVQSLSGEHRRSTVFDMRTRRFASGGYDGLRSASFCGEDTICGITTDGQYSTLVTLDMQNSRLREALFQAGPGMPYTAIYDPVYAGKDAVAFIAANGINRDILIINKVTKEIQKLQFERPLGAIRFLQSNNTDEGTILTFSWAEKNMLYRAAFCNLTTGTLKVLRQDISAGVFYPVILPRSSAPQQNSNAIPDAPEHTNTASDMTIVYAGVHAKYNALYMLSASVLTEEQASLVTYIPATAEIRSAPAKVELLKPKKYRYLSWMWRVFPVLYPVLPGNAQNAQETGLAFDIYGIDPTTLISFKTASVFYFKPFFSQVYTTVTVNSKPVQFSINGYDLNNRFRYRTAGGSVNASLPLPAKNEYRHITLGAGISAEMFSFFPKQYATEKTLYGYKLGDAVLSEQAEFRYAYLEPITRLDRHFFAKSTQGAALQIGIKHGHHFESKTDAAVVQALATLYAPVLPFRFGLSGYSGYNASYVPEFGSYVFFGVPAFMGLASYLPSMSEHLRSSTPIQAGGSTINAGVAFDTEVTVLSCEIQSGDSWLPIFYNRLNISVGYKNMLNFLAAGTQARSAHFYQSIYGRAVLTISAIASAGLEYAHPLKRNAGGTLKFLFDIDL